MDRLDAVPADRRDIVGSALDAAFGAAAELTPLEPVSGGASGALIYGFAEGQRPLLLRLETRRDSFRNPHQYACMRTAAEAGIAPRLHHVDETAGVAVMDFLPQRPLADYPGGPVTLARDLGQLIARLQATPCFPQLRDYPVVLERMLGLLRGSGRFAAGLLDAHAAGFARIRDAYPWDAATLVSSHNDPNPRNIIFDGERLWLVDWETAYRNDSMTDVAILADNFAPTPALEDALLEAWLGRPADAVERARLTLMRPLTRLYYACLLSFATAPPATPDDDLAAPTPAEFRAAFAAGRLKPGSPETMYTLGKMCLAGFLDGIATAGFEQALRVARQG